jgi:hypothetical protein
VPPDTVAVSVIDTPECFGPLLVSEAEIAVGCVNVKVAVVTAPLPSVTVTVYAPANNPVAVADVCCVGDVLHA